MVAPYHPIHPIVPLVYSGSVTALSFDPTSDTLWAGSNTGTVSSYYGTRGARGVHFPVGGNLAVGKIVASDDSVRAYGFSGDGVGSWTKGGMNKWYYRTPTTTTAFSNTSTAAREVAVATATPDLYIVSAYNGSVVRQATVPSMITHLQYSQSHILSGSADGVLRVLDPRTGLRRESGSENSTKAFQHGFQGLECTGNYICTIGLGLRLSHPFPEPFVKIYDARNMHSLHPIPFPAGPAIVNVVPKRSATIVVTSNQGMINVVDITNPTLTEFYQLDTSSYITSAAMSPTGVYMAFGDSDGAIHLMTSVDESGSLPFNGFEGQPVVLADAPEPLADVEWSDSTPLNSIGMPYYESPLLSSWTPAFKTTGLVSPPPSKIPLQVLSTMKWNDNVAYAALPRELRGRRNVVVTNTRKQGRFRSGNSASQNDPKSPMFDGDDLIPRPYRHVEIEYSKFGVEDFDFGFYNGTEYSGLETHILNSYTNPVLQVMHYCLPIRALAKSHITTNCPREHCLLCELGFVVRMLEDARGTNCQASNFCKTVGVLAQASNAIELIDYGRMTAETDFAHTIQSFNRFLLDHLSAEGNIFPYNPVVYKHAAFSSGAPTPAAAPATQLMGIDAKTIITCLTCRTSREKENMSHVVDMVYPRLAPFSDRRPPADFASILRQSLLRHVTHKAPCQSCKHLATFSSRRQISTRDLPPLLSLNACVNNDDPVTYKFWQDARSGSFLQPRVQVHGTIDGMDDPDVAEYELKAIIVQIVRKDNQSHLVAIVKVPDGQKNSSINSPWFVFNDFSVKNVSEQEALSFPDKWKFPAILYLERVDTRDALDLTSLPNETDTAILCRDTNISINRNIANIRHENLRFDELPTPGTLVAIDAEFVQMQREESEYRSDGSTKVLRPARMSLARVSVLRGNGPKEGKPFIDEHIHTSELIVDYLTEYSGIKPGDLDPQFSPHTLTPLKVVYKKLRMLVDRGCIFIGHGLSKDFRIINIFVPPEQVIDTVDLYFIKSRQRRLSLKFLSWIILDQNIQSETHDSIEDARTALLLYKKYHEFEEQGIFDQKLDEVYKEGRHYNFKPPPPIESAAKMSLEHAQISAAPTPPQQQSPFARTMYPASHSSSPAPPNYFGVGNPNPNAMYSQNWRR